MPGPWGLFTTRLLKQNNSINTVSYTTHSGYRAATCKRFALH